MFSHDTGQGQPQLPVSPAITRANSPYAYNDSVPIWPICFSLSIQYSVGFMRYSTLYYKMGFALNDFAKL